MRDDPRVGAAVEMLNARDLELKDIIETARSDTSRGYERLKRWKERTSRLISEMVNPAEGERLRRKQKLSFMMGQPFHNLVDEVRMYSAFITTLRDEIVEHPSEVFEAAIPASSVARAAPAPSARGVVFIVHGRDELNLLRLRDALRERWGLETIVMKVEPGKGRTLIEKFEDEAQRASFAFVLLTPDDVVRGFKDDEYAQARPNVTFELGWFYGRLGRSRVCILFKAGTQIHSDLDGVSRVEFREDVTEKIPEIEKELIGAEILRRG